MKIIIVGAGQVGATLAENLVGERNDITLIDPMRDRLLQLQEKYDLRGVVGNGTHPDTLRAAGADDADMLIAVTSTDEVNMLACQVAYSIFNTPTKIARIRSEQYIRYAAKLFHRKDMPVDHVIAPEQLVTQYIKRLLDYPGTLQVMDFAGGKVSLVALKAHAGGKLVGHAIAALRQHIPKIDTRVAAIFRQGRAIQPTADTIIEIDDEVFFVANSSHIRTVMQELRRLERTYRRVMIAGGGLIGAGLAQTLSQHHRVKLVEADRERAEFLAENLDDIVVLHSEAADQQMLSEERVEDIDVFIAVTNNDEANIMSAMLAKRMGARKTMVLIQRNAYVDLVEGGDIDIAISPQDATISALLRHIRRGDIVNVYPLRKGAAEAIEAIAHGDEKTSKVVDRSISEIALPPGATIGAIVRGNEVIIAHSDTIIRSDDHVVMFLLDKKYISDVERLFAPSPLFF